MLAVASAPSCDPWPVTRGYDRGMDTDPQLARVSARLKDAFAALAGADVAPDDRERLQRRLIAVTNTAKHDLGSAEAALDRFDVELAAALSRSS